MLALAIGKMIKNKGLFFCLLVACVFSVALIASMPVYESAIKKRMLQRELFNVQFETGLPPIVYSITVSDLEIMEQADGNIETADTWIQNTIIPRYRLPVVANQITLAHRTSSFFHVSPNDELALISNGRITYSYGFFNHVELVTGRFPDTLKVSGVIEAVVSENAAAGVPFMLGTEYLQIYHSPFDEPEELTRFIVVGVVRKKNPADLFWVVPLSDRNPYTTHESFINNFQVDEATRFTAHWTTTLDHTAIGPKNIQVILDAARNVSLGNLTNTNILQNAATRETELRTFLLVLLMPNLALLVFFIIMMSGLIIDHDKVEISLLYSRGIEKSRIIAMYAIQALLLSAVAMLAGIPLSLLFCLILGASSGFLEFVGRAPLEVAVALDVFLYATIGAVLFIMSMLLPIIFSKSTSIVAERRARALQWTKPFFEKYYLDFILVGVSLYGFFSYQNLKNILTGTGAKVTEYAIDPLIFLISTFFFLGFAMLFTRFFPYIIRLLFRAGKSIWPPPIYASLSSARSRPRSRYIMLLIIMTASVGLYTANAARTINQNYLDRVMFDIGADLVIQERWPFLDPNPQFVDNGATYVIPHVKDAFFTEMPFEIFNEPDGVVLATKVYRNDRAVVMSPGKPNENNVNVIAIYPDEFAKVSWRRSDMYNYHLNYKMNAMSINPNVVLLSRNLMDRFGISHGDEVSVWWANNSGALQCYVYDAVDFFPSFNPVGLDGSPAYLIVMNYELVKSEFRIEPYEVWIMKEDGASSADIMQYLIDNRVSFPVGYDVRLDVHIVDYNRPQFRVFDAETMKATVRNDPIILSMNGFLTMSFVITLAVTAIGFLVFWIFDLRSRRLQISIMRSKGMSQGGVIAMMLWEQTLLTLLPLIAGFGIGGIGSMLFVPMFEMDSPESTLPFLVFRLFSDSLRMGAIVGGIMLLAIVMLWHMAGRIKISQTLKLGEE
jgi:putative ABC transport system permease protein